jgi:putative Flp pilus-assembly TadE/G-like protein
MHNLLRCRRGSVAMATVIALVPLIGVVAIGGEAGSWYVTKQHAQNAADSAAMAGAYTIAIQKVASPTISDSQTYDYRGKQFAAQNAFCNAGDTSYPGSTCTPPPADTTRTVQIDRGNFAAPDSWTSSATGTAVRAIVSQQQPAYLSKLLGLSTVNIPAQAIAKVDNPKELCILGLGTSPSNQSALTLSGGGSLNGNGCGLMSNDTVKYSSTPTFNGPGWAINAVNGCKAGNCDIGVPHNYNTLPATNPLQVLDALFTTWSGKNSFQPVPNSPSTCYKGLTVNNAGSSQNLAAGTYFFCDAAISITGGTVTGTGVTLVLLGDSKLSITGGTVNLSAPTNNTTYPALSGVLIDDQAPNKSNLAVNVNGGGTVTLGGAMYFPNVDVTWSGTAQNANTTCSQVIANTLNLGGNAYISTQNCVRSTVSQTQVVVLVK